MDNQLENYTEQLAIFMKQKQSEIDVPMNINLVKEKNGRKKPKMKIDQIFYVAK
tara:strand:+ start:457 stop:618 length:162 start_codon:yes stop_codon:yes gene_type:complete